MMILSASERGRVRPGDIVADVSTSRDLRYPMHVGIFAEPMARNLPSGAIAVSVVSVPGVPGGNSLGETQWHYPAVAGAYTADAIGQRGDVDEARLGEIFALWTILRAEMSARRRSCKWNIRFRTAGRLRRNGVWFVKSATCTQFANYLYILAHIKLVNKSCRVPADPHRIFPGSVLNAFWRGDYPVRAWDNRMQRYPDCLYGTRSLSV
jgi:hypothetical protein